MWPTLGHRRSLVHHQARLLSHLVQEHGMGCSISYDLCNVSVCVM